MTLAVSAGARAQTVHLPVTEFTSDQLFLTGWNDPASGNIVFFDAFGKLSPAVTGLNTQYGGDLSIDDQGDGTQRVVLVLHTKDGLCYGRNKAGVLAFGRLSGQVTSENPASSGDGLFRFEFTMPSSPAGGPYVFPQSITALTAANDAMATATVTCKGELRAGTAAFPTGFSEGQPGFAHTTQTGLFDTGADAGGTGCPAEKDANCFPSERVTFKAVGKKN
jgi:hypothetical protein